MGPARLKDLGDIQEMIRTLNLSDTFAEQLDSCASDIYRQLWREVQVGAGAAR